MKTPLTGLFQCSTRPVPVHVARADHAAQDARIAACYGLPPETVAAFRDLNPVGYRSLLAHAARMEAMPGIANATVDRAWEFFRRPDVWIVLSAAVALLVGMSWIDGSFLP